MARAPKAMLAVMPSISELGSILGTVARREAAIDLMPLEPDNPTNEEERRAQRQELMRRLTADRLLVSQLDALRSLIGTMPAQTLSDCVVQINVAAHWVMRATNYDLELAEVKEVCVNLERVMISVLPVMAAAAGMDLAEYALDEVVGLHEGRFPRLAA